MTEENSATAAMASDAIEEARPASLPDGEYAIVEIRGHRTIVGRIAEIERFGAKYLGIEAIWRDELLPAVLIGGTSVYQLTPCSAEVGAKRQPKHRYQLPDAIALIAPGEPEQRFAPRFLTSDLDDEDDDNGSSDAGRYGDGYLDDGSIQP